MKNIDLSRRQFIIGGGGRIAVYYTLNNGYNLALITANAGGAELNRRLK